MASEMSAAPQPEVYDKSTPGRGYVVVIYGLYIGSIMAVVTAPIGMCIAFFRKGRSAPWLDTHLVFQFRTFWLGVLASVVALLAWHLAGQWGLAPVYAWIFGYLFFTVGIAWMMGRCAVGIHRLTANRAIDAPKSWLFGLRR
ncbi:MAG: hypothetical protein KDI17_14795 [Halioglobus sp.]|nr:hypothetical protein [Halioglobus sp.]